MDLKLGDDIYDSFRAYQNDAAARVRVDGRRVRLPRARRAPLGRRHPGRAAAADRRVPGRIRDAAPLGTEAAGSEPMFTRNLRHPKLRAKPRPVAVFDDAMACSTNSHAAPALPNRHGSADGAHGRARRSRSTSSDLNFYYGAKRALENISHRHPAQPGDRVHRPVGLRQEHVPAHAEPDERHHPGHARRGPGPHRRRRHLRAADATSSALRRRVGMVFQKSNPFPKSIFENVAYGLAHQRARRDRAPSCTARVEESLKAAALWDEVKDRLHESALALSGGQQQRLCIARALAVKPEILLMDEPASALDPIATQRIEELIYQLKTHYTIVIVTHNMQQAARVSDYTAFFWLGKLVECGRTDQIFTDPTEKLTEDYVTGQVRRRPSHGACRTRSSSGISRRSSNSSRRGCSKWAGSPRSACARRSRGWSSATPTLIDARARRRRADQPAAHRDRQPLLQAAGAAPADGRRPARDRRGGQDQHRPRARRRPGGQHRRGGAALHARTRRSRS